MWRKLYLYQVFIHSKFLFAVFLLALVGTIIAAYRTQEQFPILLYGMYSLKEYPQSSYTTYRIEISGQPIVLSSLPDAQHELIQTTLGHAIDLKKSNLISETEWKKFLKWLFTYSADMRVIDENVMTIYELICHYSNGKPVIDSEKQVYYYDGSGE